MRSVDTTVVTDRDDEHSSPRLGTAAVLPPPFRRHNSHTYNSPSKVHNPVVFSIFMKLGSHHHCLILEILIASKRNTVPVRRESGSSTQQGGGLGSLLNLENPGCCEDPGRGM